MSPRPGAASRPFGTTGWPPVRTPCSRSWPWAAPWSSRTASPCEVRLPGREPCSILRAMPRPWSRAAAFSSMPPPPQGTSASGRGCRRRPGCRGRQSASCKSCRCRGIRWPARNNPKLHLCKLTDYPASLFFPPHPAPSTFSSSFSPRWPRSLKAFCPWSTVGATAPSRVHGRKQGYNGSYFSLIVFDSRSESLFFYCHSDAM